MYRILKLQGILLFFIAYHTYAQTVAKAEKYAQTPFPVGNIAYNYKGELIYSNHPFYAPEIKVMYYNPDNKEATPYPNLTWNTKHKTDDHYLDDVLGIRTDSKGVVWMLDMGLKSGITPKLVGWNTHTNTLQKIYYIPQPASIHYSQLNDFVIDESRNIVVIADEAIGNGGDGTKAALVILDLNTGLCRRLLEGDSTTRPEDIPITYKNKNLYIPGTQKNLLVGADGITLDKNNEWLYYAPLNGSKLYRIKMDDLLSSKNPSLKTEIYANKSNNGGLSIDDNGNVYLTLVGDNAIGIIPADTRKQYNYVYDTDLVWPDGVSYNKDGYMYVAAAQLPLAKIFNNGKGENAKPYFIFRFKPIGKGIFGR